MVLGWGLKEEYFSAFPTCFDVDIFSVTRYAGITQVLSAFLSKGNVQCVPVYSVSLGRGKFRSLPYHHLNPEPELMEFHAYF